MANALMRSRALRNVAASRAGRGAASFAARTAASTARGAVSSIRFRDVSVEAHIYDVGISFGASAGDFDGDGWPDIFTGGHYTGHPRLWHNNQDGTFTDVVSSWMQPVPSGDMHGAQWADLDNDGRPELYVLRGANYGLGSSPKLLYRWNGTHFVEVAAQLGLDVPLMRGRTPLAIDHDGDGRLDMFVAASLRPDGQAPPTLFAQRGGLFQDVGPGLGLVLGDTWFGVLGDLDGDHVADALFHGYPTSAFAFANGRPISIGAAIGLPFVWAMNDCVVADLDGDCENEIYFACDERRSAFHRDGPFTLEFHAMVANGEHEVRFSAPPGHVVWFDWNLCSAADVFIGAAGLHPSPFGAVLDPGNPLQAGVAPHVPGVSHGVYVGWNQATSEWSIACSSAVWTNILLRAIASQPITVPYAVGFNPSPPQVSDRLYSRVNGQYVDRTAASGIPAWLNGRSVVAADFDNDMDLDLYVVTTTSSHNTPNVLLENLGGGVFVPIPAGAAAGSSDGVGDVAIALDYDCDGLVDLFLVNGDCEEFRSGGSPGAFADDGPAQLLRNTTSTTNHWLGIDLIGSASNREGIGARIEVIAGGVRQVRENGGGMHAFAQNHGLHFGLGANATARVEVTWPSGKRTVLPTVASNQYLRIVE